MNLKHSVIQLSGYSIFLLLFFALPLKAQVKIGDNAGLPKSFSVLELSSTKGGLRLPQLTTAERDALVAGLTGDDADAAKGLVIYNKETKCMQYWNGTKWVRFDFSEK